LSDIVHELKEGVSFGTLGDSRKEEWNELNSLMAEEKARKRPSNKDDKKDLVMNLLNIIKKIIPTPIIVIIVTQ